MGEDNRVEDEMVKGFRRRWMEMARKAGDFQARLLLSAFYFVIVVPIGLIVRSSDPLRVKRQGGPDWTPVEDRPDGLEELRKQF